MNILSFFISFLLGLGVNVSMNESSNKLAPLESITPAEEIAAEISPATQNVAGLAQCLTEKGVKFYGAFWCPHCTEQKKLFGNAAANLPYIECDARGTNPNPGACTAAGIEAYPTWVFQDGQKKTGVQKLPELAQLSGCTL